MESDKNFGMLRISIIHWISSNWKKTLAAKSYADNFLNPGINLFKVEVKSYKNVMPAETFQLGIFGRIHNRTKIKRSTGISAFSWLKMSGFGGFIFLSDKVTEDKSDWEDEEITFYEIFLSPSAVSV